MRAHVFARSAKVVPAVLIDIAGMSGLDRCPFALQLLANWTCDDRPSTGRPAAADTNGRTSSRQPMSDDGRDYLLTSSVLMAANPDATTTDVLRENNAVLCSYSRMLADRAARPAADYMRLAFLVPDIDVPADETEVKRSEVGVVAAEDRVELKSRRDCICCAHCDFCRRIARLIDAFDSRQFVDRGTQTDPMPVRDDDRRSVMAVKSQIIDYGEVFYPPPPPSTATINGLYDRNGDLDRSTAATAWRTRNVDSIDRNLDDDWADVGGLNFHRNRTIDLHDHDDQSDEDVDSVQSYDNDSLNGYVEDRVPFGELLLQTNSHSGVKGQLKDAPGDSVKTELPSASLGNFDRINGRHNDELAFGVKDQSVFRHPPARIDLDQIKGQIYSCDLKSVGDLVGRVKEQTFTCNSELSKISVNGAEERMEAEPISTTDRKRQQSIDDDDPKASEYRRIGFRPSLAPETMTSSTELFADYLKLLILQQQRRFDAQFWHRYRPAFAPLPTMTQRQLAHCRRRFGRQFNADQLRRLFVSCLRASAWTPPRPTRISPESEAIPIVSDHRQSPMTASSIASSIAPKSPMTASSIESSIASKSPPSMTRTRTLPADLSRSIPNTESPIDTSTTRIKKSLLIKLNRATLMRAQAIQSKRWGQCR